MCTVRHLLVSGILGAALLLPPGAASAQQAPAGQGVGVVTAIHGQATVARQAVPEPASLRFKDDVFFRDQITTKERSSVRLLLGGKGVLTVREQSQVTLDETVAPDGGRRSVLSLLVGKIGAAIARTLMLPGEEVEIRTPNAVAAVRGTVLIVEYIPPKQNAEAPKPILLASSAPGPMLAQTSGGGGGTSKIVVLSGSVTVTPLGQPPVTVDAMQSLTVTATPAGIQVGAVQTLTPDQALQAAQGLEMTKPHTGEVAGGANVQGQTLIAAELASSLVTTLTGETPPAPAPAPVAPPATLPPVNRSECAGQSGCPPSSGGEGGTPISTLPAGPVLTLNHGGLAFLTTPLVTFSGGDQSAVISEPEHISPRGGAPYIPEPSPLVETTGTIVHFGPMVTLTDFTLIGDSSRVPLVQISGTSVTNTGGPVFSLDSASLLGTPSLISTHGPLLSLDTLGSATLAGLVEAAGTSILELGPADAVRIPTRSSLTATAPLFNLTGGSSLSTSGGGSLVSMDPSTLTLSAPILSLSGGSTAALSGSVLNTADSTVDASSTGGLVALQNGTLNLTGPALLESQGSTLSFAGPMVSLSGTSALTSSGAETPLFHVTGGALTLTGSGALLKMTGGNLQVGGPALTVEDSTITAAGPLFAVTGGSVSGPLLRATGSTFNLGTNSLLALSGTGSIVINAGPAPLLQISGGTPPSGAPLVGLGSGSLISTQGPLLSLDLAGSASLAGLVDAAGASTLELGPADAVTILTGTSLTATAPLFNLSGRSQLITTGVGSLVSMDTSTLTLSAPILSLSGSPASFSGPVLSAVDGTIKSTQPLIMLQSGSTLTSSSANGVFHLANSSLDLGSRPLVSLRGGSTFTTAPLEPTTTGRPLVRIDGGSLAADSLGSTDGNGNAWNLTGTLLYLTNNATVTLRAMGSEPATGTDRFSHIREPGEPAIHLVDSTLRLTGTGEPLVSTEGPASTSSTYQDGVAVIATASTPAGGTITTQGALLQISQEGGVYLSDPNPQLQFTNMTVNALGLNSLIEVLGQSRTDSFVGFYGPLLSATNSAITVPNQGMLSVGGGAYVSSTPSSGSPVLQLDSSTVSSAGMALITGTNTSVYLANPLLVTHGAIINTGGSFLQVSSGGYLTSVNPGALVQLNGGSASATGSFAQVDGGSVLNLNNIGGLLAVGDGGTMNVGGSLLSASGSAKIIATTDMGSLVQLDTASMNLTNGGSLLSLNTGAIMTGVGTSLVSTNSILNVGGALFSIGGGSSATFSRGPLVWMSGGSLTADTFFFSDGAENTVHLAGTLLDLSNNASFTVRAIANDLGPSADSVTQTLAVGEPMIRMSTGSRLTLTGSGEALLDPGTEEQTIVDGLGLIADGGSAIHLAGPLLRLSGVSLTATDAYVQLTDMTVTQTGSSSLIEVSGGGAELSVSLAGPLLSAANSNLSIGGSLLALQYGASLTSSTPQALLQVNGGSIGGSSSEPFIKMDSANATLSGPLFKATNLAFPNVTRTAPLLRLAGSSLTVGGPLLDLTLTAPTDGYSLDLGAQPLARMAGSSLLESTTGPLFRITGGSLNADALIATDGTGSLAFNGPLLDLNNTSIRLRALANGEISSFTYNLTANEPVIRMTGSHLITTGAKQLVEFNAAMFPCSGECISMSPGVALTATGSTLNLNGPLLTLAGNLGDFGLLSTQPQILLNNTAVTESGTSPLITAESGMAILSGPLFKAVNGSTVTTTTSQPLMAFSNTVVMTNGSFFNLGSGPGEAGTRATLAGPLLTASNSHLNSGAVSSFISIRDGATFTGSTLPLLTFDGGSVTTQSHLVRIGLNNAWESITSAWVPTDSQGPVRVTLDGPLLQGTDTNIIATSSVLTIRDSSTFTSNTTAPLIQLGGEIGSALILGGPDPDATSPNYGQQVNSQVFGVAPALTNAFAASAELWGPVLSASNTTIVTADRILGIFGATGGSATLTSHTTSPLVQLTGSTVTMAGTFAPTTSPSGKTEDTSGSFLRMSSPDSANPATLTVVGPLLSATGTVFDGHDHFLKIRSNAQLTSTSPSALVNLSGGSLTTNGIEIFTPTSGSPTSTTFGDFARIQGSGASLTLAGPLLNSGAPLHLAGSVLQIRDGGTLTDTFTPPTSLALLNFSNTNVQMNGSVFQLRSGSAQPGSSATLARPVLTASNTTFDTGPTGGNFVNVRDGSNLTATTSDALLQLNNSNVIRAGEFLRFARQHDGSGSNDPVSVTLAGPALSATNSAINAVWDLFSVGDGTTFQSTTSSPLLQLSGTASTTITLGGLDPDPASPTFNQPQYPSMFNVGHRSTLYTNAPSSVSLAGPVLSAANGTISTWGRIIGIYGQTGASTTVTSTTLDPMVQLSGGRLAMSGFYPPTSDTSGTWTSTSGSFLEMSSPDPLARATLSLSGPLLQASNTLIDAHNNFLGLSSNANLASTGIASLIQLSNSPLTAVGTSKYTPTPPGEPSTSTYGDFLSVRNGSVMSLAGPLLTATGGSIIVGGNFMSLWGGNLTSTTESPLVSLTNTFLGSEGPSYSGDYLIIDGGSAMSLAGPLLDDSGSAYALGGNFLRLRNGASLTYTSISPTPSPLLQFSDSTVNMNGHLFSLNSDAGQPGSAASLAGPLLSAANTHFDAGPQSSFVYVTGGATFTSTTTLPLLTLDGGSVTTKAHLVKFGVDSKWSGGSTGAWVPDGSSDPVSATLAGPVLMGTGTTITATSSIVGVRDRATFRSTTTAPLIQLGSSALTLGGPDPDPNSPTFGQQANGRVFDVGSGLSAPYAAATSAELSGPVLSATSTTISTTDRVLGVFGGPGASATLTSHTTDPLVQLSGGSVSMSGTFYPPTTNYSGTTIIGTTTDSSGSFLRMSSPDPAAPATLTLAGPLLHATGTTFDGHDHFLKIRSNAQVTSTSTNPLVQFSGAKLSINGIETFEPLPSGTTATTTFGDFARVQGTGASLSLAGPLLVDSGSTFDMVGRFLRVQDGATFTDGSTQPLLQLTDSNVTNGAAFRVLSDPGKPGSSISLQGPILAATRAPINSGNMNLLDVRDGASFSSATGSPLVQLDSSALSGTVGGGGISFGRSYDGTRSEGPVNATINGPLLVATDSPIDLVYNLVNIGDRTTFQSNTNDPLVQLVGTSESPLKVNIGGIDRDSTYANPNFGKQSYSGVFHVNHRTLPNLPTTVDLKGPMLDTNNVDLSVNGTVLGIWGGPSGGSSSVTVTSPTADPLVHVTGGSLTMASTRSSTDTSGTTASTDGHFLTMSAPSADALASLTANGPLLQADTTAPILAQNDFLGLYGNVRLASTGTAPAIQLTNSPLTVIGTRTFTPVGGGSPTTTTFGNFLIANSNTIVTLAGPLLSATNSDVQVAERLIGIFGQTGGSASISSTTPNSFVQLNGGALTMAGGGQPFQAGDGTGTFSTPSGSFLQMGSPDPAFLTTMMLVGSDSPAEAVLLSATGTAITAQNNFLWLSDNTSFSSTGTAPLVQLTNGPLTIQSLQTFTPTTGAPSTSINGSLLNVCCGNASVTLAGPLISSTDSNVDVASEVVGIRVGTGGGNITVSSSSPNPFVQLSGGTLTLAGTTWPFTSADGTFTSTSGSLLQISSGNPAGLASLSLAGPLLRADNTVISAQSDFLAVSGKANVTSTGTAPLVQLTNSPLTVIGTSTFTPVESAPVTSNYGNLLNVFNGAAVSLGGPLLQAAGSGLVLGSSLLSITDGGQLTSTLATAGQSLFQLTGINTDAQGLGNDTVLQVGTGSPIINLSSSPASAPAAVNLSGPGNLLTVDKGLLAASGQIVNAITAVLNVNGNPSDLTKGALHFNQSSVPNLGGGVQLNNSLLTVSNGPLLSVTGGTQMNISNDFATLLNGSKVQVLNGPLIYVGGTSPTGTASTLNVTGGLVSFGGTGGNQVIINNGISPSGGTPGGIPVAKDTNPNTAITISGTPIKGSPSLGTVTVNGTLVTPTGTSYTGSLIQATGGGKVTIQGR